MEVKAGGTHRREDLRGLTLLRDRLGDRFVGGVLMHTGERPGPVEDHIALVPVETLWEA